MPSYVDNSLSCNYSNHLNTHHIKFALSLNNFITCQGNNRPYRHVKNIVQALQIGRQKGLFVATQTLQYIFKNRESKGANHYSCQLILYALYPHNHAMFQRPARVYPSIFKHRSKVLHFCPALAAKPAYFNSTENNLKCIGGKPKRWNSLFTIKVLRVLWNLNSRNYRIYVNNATALRFC